MHPNPNKEGLAPCPSNQVRAELDESYFAVPWKGYIARGEMKGWESTKKSSSVLDVRGQKVVQTFFFWTISALYTSRCIGITPGRTAWRGLRKSHRRNIFISSSHYSRILVTRHAKWGTINMLGNVISVRDSRQTFTSLEEFSILFPALGLLLNGVWIL